VSPNQLDILRQLEETTTNLLAELEKSLPAINEALYAEVLDLIAGLDKTITGRVKATVANLKKVNSFRGVLDKVADQQEYGQAIGAFLKGFDTTSSLINEYFITVVKDFHGNKSAYEAIRQANIQTTVDGLLGSGLDTNLKDPVIKMLRQNVAGATDSKALRQLLKNEILGTPTANPKLVSYVKQVSSDSLYQYEANYLQAVSQDLELKYYYYQGTKIADSRQFCVERAGKYFREEEVRSWGSLHWAGQIKGTNADNILTNRGGYNCSHLIIPISKELYERQTGQKSS